MKTLKINGRKMQLSTPAERGLRRLKTLGFVAAKSEFWEGPRKWQRFILPITDELGTTDICREFSGNSKRATKWFEKHPRHRFAIVGNPRRINAILRQLDGEGA